MCVETQSLLSYVIMVGYYACLVLMGRIIFLSLFHLIGEELFNFVPVHGILIYCMYVNIMKPIAYSSILNIVHYSI